MSNCRIRRVFLGAGTVSAPGQGQKLGTDTGFPHPSFAWGGLARQFLSWLNTVAATSVPRIYFARPHRAARTACSVVRCCLMASSVPPRVRLALHRLRAWTDMGGLTAQRLRGAS